MLIMFFYFLLLATYTVVSFSFVTTINARSTHPIATAAAPFPNRFIPRLTTIEIEVKRTPNNNEEDLDTEQLLTLCYASSLSYLPIQSISTSSYASQPLAHKLTPIVQVVEPQTQSGATIFEHSDSNSIIVACRGSATPKNFLTNLRFQLKPMSARFDTDACAHEGFQEAAGGLWGLLEPHLIDFSGKDIIFTGHSLGGGTAELCALYASLGGSTCISQLVTFGGPCIGDSAFSRYVNNVALPNTAVRHVVHGADPILASNSPLWEKLGFVRSGETVVCDPFKAKVYDSGEDVVPSFVPWNILDHCQYLGVFVGPRLI